MNNKSLNFNLCKIWRILQISEGVIHLGHITPSLTLICRIQQLLNVLTLGLHCQRKEVQLLTSWFRPLSASIFWEESLNVVSASSLAISFPINVDGTVSNSFHNVWMECLSSLKVFTLLTWDKKWQKLSKALLTGCKESKFYSLSFGKAESSIY